jgi:hypothetical protein
MPTVLSLWLDVRSILIAAIISGRGNTKPQSIGTLLNFPLFFLLFFAASLVIAPTIGLAAGIFAISSSARFVFMRGNGALPDGIDQLGATMLGALGAQQVFNYFLFRADQILIGFDSMNRLIDPAPESLLSRYLLYAKVYELACTVISLACMVALPRASSVEGLACKSHGSPSKDLSRRTTRVLSVSLVSLCMLTLIYGWVSPDNNLHLPFFAATGLSLLVNFQTLLFLRRSSLDRLIIALVAALAVGAMFVAFRSQPISLQQLAYMVPVQMFVFIAFLYRS